MVPLSFHPCNIHRSSSTHLMDKEVDSWCYMYFHAKSSGQAWIQTLVVQVEYLVPWIMILHCFYFFQEKESLILNLYRYIFCGHPLHKMLGFIRYKLAKSLNQYSFLECSSLVIICGSIFTSLSEYYDVLRIPLSVTSNQFTELPRSDLE